MEASVAAPADEAPGPAPEKPRLVLRGENVQKAYGATHALKGVDFEIEGGKVVALLGENGAGKSTLMKILSGVEKPTGGTIRLQDSPIEFDSPSDAVDHGIAIIHQELNLCGNLSITDNIFLGREMTKGGFVAADQQRRLAQEVLERLELDVDPSTDVAELTLGQQQLVEIARALREDARILIMDEPTSALSEAEVEILFSVIRELVADGVGIVYISHHLEECLEIADQAVVLRDGAIVADEPMKSVDMAWIVRQMVGRDEDALYERESAEVGEPLLEVRDLVVADPATPGKLSVRNASITVHEGEVIGIFGLMGAGRTELLEALAGSRPIESGTVSLTGADITRDPVSRRIEDGLVLVPENRQRDGLVQSVDIGQNLTLSAIERFLSFAFVKDRAAKTAAGESATAVKLKHGGLSMPIGSLSGGNQQKVVIGKALMTEPTVVLLDEPSRGIDVGAKADIFGLMSAQARQGRGVLFATSEAAEVLNLADRILVMSRGEIVAELDPAETTREQLMALADTGEKNDGADA